MKKKIKWQLIFAAISVFVVLISITAFTYAWFTFSTVTNVEPMASSIGDGDSSLFISNSYDGPFEESCDLIFSAYPDSLQPVSTADLNSFYISKVQNRNGISLLYKDVTDEYSDYLISGTLYLKCTGDACDVYFWSQGLKLGGDIQTCSSMRLGLNITGDNINNNYIFRLDGLSDGVPQEQQTVPQENVVVASLDSMGQAVYSKDTSIDILDYMSTQGIAEGNPGAGNNMLFSLDAEKVVVIKYWIYLEGCDNNCINIVQSRDVPINFGFSGVTRVQ